MFNLKSEIKITPPADSSRKTVIYPFVTNVDIVSSFDNLTDKAVFSVPKSIKSTKDVDIYTLIEVGDKVDIKLNYDDFNTTRFKGYLSEITPSVPLVVNCEDEMFMFKTFALKGKNYNNTTLKEVVEYVFSQAQSKSELWNGQTYNILSDIDLGKFEIGEGALPLKVFEELKKTYGIVTYVKDRVFYIGFQFSEKAITPKTITIENQVINDDTRVNTDKYRTLLIKAKSIGKDGKTLETTSGSPGGDTISKIYYNISSISSLQKLADAEHERLKQSGLKGSFTTFLHPKLEHSTEVKVVSTLNPEKNETVFIRSVKTSSGVGGGRQEIILGGI